MSVFDRFFHRPAAPVDPQKLPILGKAQELRGLSLWLNANPLTLTELKGRVVLVHFWTYSCVNCVHTMPSVQAWHDRYAATGLTVLGIHSPEFEFEKDEANVREAVVRHGITYPVALDPDFATWNAYKNRYWPADYLIDAKGNVRYVHFGEGGYDTTEAVIQSLLAEAGHAFDASPVVPGERASSESLGTPETYLGFDRSEYLGSPESVRKDEPQRYTTVRTPAVNVYYLEGLWETHDGFAVPTEPGAALLYTVNAASAHMVMVGEHGKGRVRVTLDGKPLTSNECGRDVRIENGESVLVAREGRMYDVFDLHGKRETRLMRLEFLDTGTRCYALTFG